MENIISSTLIQHIEEEPSQVQQNTVALNHINVEVIPPRELPVKDVFICTDVEILTSKSKNSPLSDYISDNSSEYESAGSTKCSSTHSVNEVVNQEMGSEKVVTPTLLGNALKAIKNVFSPSDKGKSKSLSASTPDEKISKEIFKETSNSENLQNGLDSKKMDYLDVSALGARLSSISLESQNVTDDSFTTTTSRFDDSFQSTVTHLDEHNISDPDSHNQSKSDETFVEVPIDLDLDISCNETLGPQDNCLEETLLRRNSLNSSSESKEADKMPEENNSVLEIIKMENSTEGRGIKCSTPITGDESVVMINSTLDKSENLGKMNETIVIEGKNLEKMNETIVLEGKNENFGEMASPIEIDSREGNKTFEIKNETFNVNEKTFNLDTDEKENVLNSVNDKTFELEAKEFMKEMEVKAINLEKSISESFEKEKDVDGISNEAFSLDNNKNDAELETTFSVEKGNVNDKTFDMGVEDCPVEGSVPRMLLEKYSLEDAAQVSDVLASNNELQKTFDLDDFNDKDEEEIEESEYEERVYEPLGNFNSAEEYEKYLISKGVEIVTYHITGTTPQEFINRDLSSTDVTKGSLETILETSLPENAVQSPINTLHEAVAPAINSESQLNGFESLAKSLSPEEKSPELLEAEKLERSLSIPEDLSESLINGLEKINLGEEKSTNVENTEICENKSDEFGKFEGATPQKFEDIEKTKVPKELESVENGFQVQENINELSESKKLEDESVVPEILTQNENLEPEQINFKPVTPEISTQNVPKDFERVEESLESLEKASEYEEKMCLEPIVPEILTQNSPNVPEPAETFLNTENIVEPEKSNLKPESSELQVVNEGEKNKTEIIELEKVNFEKAMPEISNVNAQNESELVKKDLNFQEKDEKDEESAKIDLEPIVPEISNQNLPNEAEMLEKSMESQEKISELAEDNKVSRKSPVPEISAQNLLASSEVLEEELPSPAGKILELEKPDNINLEQSEPVTPSEILSKTVELENSFNVKSPSTENNKLEPEKLDVETPVPAKMLVENNVEIIKSPVVEKLPGRLEKLISENSIKENGLNDSGADSEKFFECETPENKHFNASMPEIQPNVLQSEKIAHENSPKYDNEILIPEKFNKEFNFEMGIEKEENKTPVFNSTFEVKLNSQAKHPEATKIDFMKPDESIKTELNSTSKSQIDSPFDFLNNSKNIFHSLSNTPKKFDPESEDLIAGMENLKLDDSLKLPDNDDQNFFGKIEHNSLLEDKLSSPSKSDKTGSDTDLAQLIQEQFTANDIEKICSVVDEIPMANLNRQIMRASQLFEKSFHDKFFEDEEPLNIQNSLSPEGLDFLDSIQSKSSGRDFSRESLYVKFDPLIEPKKEETRTEILLNISPIKQPVNVVAPLTPLNNKKEEKDENKDKRVRELQLEIKRLTQLYLDRETANNEKINDYENQIAKLTGQACILENKLRESNEREKALVRKLKEQKQQIEDLQIVMEQYTIVISKLTNELEEVKKKNKEEQDVLIAERDSYMTHLQNTEAAFSDVHTKYEKSKKTIECYKKNEIMYKNTISEQGQLIEEYKEKALEVKEKAVRELNKIHVEMDEMKSNHAQEASRVRAQLRKTELKVQALQESLDQKIKENKELTTICDDLIAGKK